jgi:hypothetical protein
VTGARDIQRIRADFDQIASFRYGTLPIVD